MFCFLYTDNIAVFAPSENCAYGSSLAIEKDITYYKDVSENFKFTPVFSNSRAAYLSMPVVNEEGTFPVRQRSEFKGLNGYDFYGGGEQLGKLRKNGEVLPVYNRDNFMYEQGKNLYQAHPWIMAVGSDGESYGFLADSTYRGEIDLRGNQLAFEFEEEAHRILVLKGETPNEVLKLLAKLIGKMTLPPKWALGYQQCRYSYESEDEMKFIIDEFRSRQLPCDVVWFDIDYMDHFKVFTFDSKTFPDPKRMNAYAHKHNFKTVWMIDPGVKVEEGYKIYEDIKQQNLYIKYSDTQEGSHHDIKIDLDLSSNPQDGYKLIDGVMSTSWQASADDQKPSIILDLNASSEILSVELYWQKSFPLDYTIHHSLDKKKWFLLGQGKGFISGGKHSLPSHKQTQARYIKLSYSSDPNQDYSLEQIMLNGESFQPLNDITNEDMFVGNVWPGRCVFPDFTRQDCSDWWRDLYPKYVSCGIDGVWNDMNEPAVFGGGPQMTVPDEVMHEGGLSIHHQTLEAGPHHRYHNVYGMLMAKATREGMLKANPNKRPFVLTRANYLGGHRYAATWTGDNKSTLKHLKLATPMCLNMGLSGQAFVGPDLGGFAGNAKADLFEQWMSIGAFYPFMRGHSSKGTNRKEPWAFGQSTEDSCRLSLHNRYRLIPYLYTLFWEASNTGLPIMRPAFFADLANKSLRKEENKFLLGNDLLIVPAWDKTKRFPKGGWKELSTLCTEFVNVYLRQGAILALGKAVNYVEEQKNYDWEFIINPNQNGKAEGLVYLDAGEGWDYLKGEQELIQLSYKKSLLKSSNNKLKVNEFTLL